MTKIAIVTGAAGDIGHSICDRLIKNKFQVIAADINLNALNKRASEAVNPQHYHPVHLDITDQLSVDQAFADVLNKFGPPTALVNNAGGITSHNLKSTTQHSWLKDIDLNLNGAWRCMNAVIDIMIAEKSGSIVNIASVNGLGIFGHPGYSVAKAGLIHLTKFAAVELGPHGIRCNAVCPGTVKTQVWLERQETNPKIIDDAMQWYPSRMASDPIDVAHIVEFILTRAPKTLNGAIINVDGGLTAGQDSVASAFCGDQL